MIMTVFVQSCQPLYSNGKAVLTLPSTGKWFLRLNRPIMSAIKIHVTIANRPEVQASPSAIERTPMLNSQADADCITVAF